MRLALLFGILGISLALAVAKSKVLRMEATAFVLDAKPTAAGTIPHTGIAAAHPSVLPLGSRVRVTGTGEWDGVYTITDSVARGNRRTIDIYVPTAAEAKRFGRRKVTVRVLEAGKGKEDAQDKSIPARKP